MFEFKRDDTVDDELNGLGKDYELHFSVDSRRVFKIGVAFDSKIHIPCRTESVAIVFL